MELLCVLCGIFAGFTAGGYMFIKPLAERDKTIAEQKEENLQVCDENKILRAEVEDLKFDLSVANKEIEMKVEIIQSFINEIERNDYNRTDLHLKKLKELADDYQSQN